MNKSLTVVRWFVGILFILSGLVKANDPLGLSYKMQEFFEAWNLNGFHDYTLAMSILMNAFEIIAGVAVIIGWRMRLFSWLLLLLILFFTFLTGYAWLAKNADGMPKFASCGCFGDCLPLTPVQSFLKDLLLLVLIGFIFLNRNSIKPLFKTAWLNVFKVVAAVLFAFGLQWYTLEHLPIVDCLPFKKGNNLVELRKLPADAVPDKYEYQFIYEKDGKQQSFAMTNLPDSTWKFVDRKQTLVAKGKNNEPKIKDFDLKNPDGVDVTNEVLERKGNYYLLFVQHFNRLKTNDAWVKQMSTLAKNNKLIIVTSVPDVAKDFFAADIILGQMQLLVCDVTAIKTAARAIPTLYKMNGAVVEGKWSAADFSQVK
jgi:uncharacterized membrane protein YphA (DoxX/SURF4 family)